MFRCRLLTDAQPRSKNGQPAHSTTGAASASSSQSSPRPGSPARLCGARCRAIARSTSGTAKAAASQSRRVMSASSGLGAAVALASFGSSAMPQIGQLPGPICSISGSIGQV